MFKKMCLSFALMCGMAVADVGPINPEFKSLLRNDGVMEKNTLKIKYYDEGEYSFKADGELIATGVLVSSPKGTYFYPDLNLQNLFFNESRAMQCLKDYQITQNCYKIKPSERYPIAIFTDDKIISKLFGGKIYGTQAVRVKAYFSSQNTGFGNASASLKNVFTLTPPKKSYAMYPKAFTHEFRYASKDDYVNIRQAPKGAIVGQIQKADTQKSSFQKGMIIGNCSVYERPGVSAEYLDCKEVNGWYEVFYFPPGIRHGKDAIHGYIHKSQIRGY